MSRGENNVATDVKVINQERYRCIDVRLNAAHTAGGMNDHIRGGRFDISSHCVAMSQIQFVAGRSQYFMFLRERMINEVPPYHTAAAGQENSHFLRSETVGV